MKLCEIMERLEKDGWKVVATEGNHVRYRHPTKPWRGNVTIPEHLDDDLNLRTFKSIQEQTGWW